MARLDRSKSVEEAKRVGRFGLVGLAATLTHLGVATFANGVLGVEPFLANVIGFVIAFAVGFGGHQWFTFANEAPFFRALRRYGLIALLGFAVNNVVLSAALALDVIGETAALAAAVLVVPAGTFLASRLWGFAPEKIVEE